MTTLWVAANAVGKKKEVGTRQLTLCPSSMNSLEPSPNLVPSEVPASGHHG